MALFDHLATWIAMTVVCIYNYFVITGFVHVQIDKGILRGGNSTTWLGTRYFSFKGIPYAKPPVDELRFKGPREETAWAGVRDAFSHGEVCPHIDMAFRTLRGKEDCLFLNIYTPSLENERLPVMFWIHGGMFLLGSGNDELYGPDYFMESGVVLVTINSRLGALGFLSTEDDGAPGNAGLKDQVAALRWVRRNIASFGGDPDNVTIFGGSSGAVCAHFHILSPMSSGLFSRVILQSGAALNEWAMSKNSANLTVRLAEALGAKDTAGDTARALEFLKTVPYEKIVNVQQSLITDAERSARIDFLFVPSVENLVTSEEVFLPDSPSEIMKSGNFTKVPCIIGYTSHEGYFFKDELEQQEVMKVAIEDTVRYIPKGIESNRTRRDLAPLVRKFYFDDKPIGNDNISNLVDLYSDATFVAEVKRATQLHLKSTNNQTYFYVFSHDGSMNLVKFFLNIGCPGAVHGDELGYLFHQRLLYWKNPLNGSRNQDVVHTMIRLWTNFARYGNPTPSGDPLNWKPATIDKFNYLNISGGAMEVDEDPDSERTDFWAKVYEKSSGLQADAAGTRLVANMNDTMPVCDSQLY